MGWVGRRTFFQRSAEPPACSFVACRAARNSLLCAPAVASHALQPTSSLFCLLAKVPAPFWVATEYCRADWRKALAVLNAVRNIVQGDSIGAR